MQMSCMGTGCVTCRPPDFQTGKDIAGRTRKFGTPGESGRDTAQSRWKMEQIDNCERFGKGRKSAEVQELPSEDLFKTKNVSAMMI